MNVSRAALPAGYGYVGHTRVVRSVAGTVQTGGNGFRKGDPFVQDFPTTVLENRVNGSIRSFTVLAGGARVTRLGPDALLG